MTRSDITKVNAVEGVTQSASSRSLFEQLDRSDASPDERRRAVIAKHAVRNG